MQPHMIQSSSLASDKAASIVEVLRERYGVDAVQVAERQLAESEGDNRVVWQAILDRLSI